MVRKYDHVKPSDMNIFLKELNMTEEEFYQIVEPMRDMDVWHKKNGNWELIDNVTNHINDENVDKCRVKLKNINEPFIRTDENKNKRFQKDSEQDQYIII